MSWFSVEYMKNNRKIAALSNVVRRRRGDKQMLAAQALAEIGDGEAARALLGLATSNDIAVWEPAQRALSGVKNDAAVPALCHCKARAGVVDQYGFRPCLGGAD